MLFGTITEKTFKENIESGYITDYTITHVAKNGTQTFEGHCHCSRCGGTGIYSNFHGMCYKCMGTGKEDMSGKIATEDQIAKNEAQRKARHAKKEAQRRAEAVKAISIPLEGKAIAPWFLGVGHGEKPIGIVKESAKAYLVLTAEPMLERWIPKTALIDEADVPVYPTNLKLVDWYYDKYFAPEIIRKIEVVGETEKAYKCIIEYTSPDDEYDYGSTTSWVSKKCLEQSED